MKILLIDNHSRHKDELIKLFGDEVTIETQEQINGLEDDNYDLVVLSGGHNTPSVLHNPDAYIKEINFVKNTKVPVLGICLGCEIITQAFDGTLKDLNSIHRGVIDITIDDEYLKKYLNEDKLQVYEAHEFGIKDIPKDFLICAHSEQGIEIIKHKTRQIIGVQFHLEVEPNAELLNWLMGELGVK